MKKNFNAKFGFTLSEILITLVVIGVIAAITIPPLMNLISDRQLKVAWRKIYSEFMNAQAKMINENGSLDDSFGIIGYSTQGGINLQSGWLPYLQTIKTCPPGSAVTQNCWYLNVNYYDNSTTWGGSRDSTVAGAILNNGMLLLFYPGISGDFSGMNTSALSSDMYIFVDVNGFKLPNTFGKDVFGINYSPKKGKFVAYDEGRTTPYCGGSGFSCSSYYLIND